MHLEHIEDLILDSHIIGANESLAHISHIIDLLTGVSISGARITTKWDGSPALFAGANPSNGKFFVGTKSIFSKSNQRVCYTRADVDDFYGDKPDLAHKLVAALEFLPELNITAPILQGDVMFGPNDVELKLIDQQEHVTFNPNSILYAIPSDTPLGCRVKSAKFGIVFHTAYTGPSLYEVESTYQISIDGLTPSPAVWYADAECLDHSQQSWLVESEIETIAAHVVIAQDLLSSVPKSTVEAALTAKPYVAMFKQYQNVLIRRGEHIGKVDDWLHGFLDFIHDKVIAEKTSLAARNRKITRLQEHTRGVWETLATVLEFQSLIVTIKLLLIRHLEANMKIKTYHTTTNGLVEAKQEGFVSISPAGRAVKLVDRLEFTRHNWNRRGEE